MSLHRVPKPNLLPIARIQSRKRDAAFRIWSFALIGMILLVGITSGLLSIHLHAAKPVEGDHINRFVSDLTEIQSAMPPLKKEVAKLESALQSQSIAESRIQWTVLLSHFAMLAGDEIRIHSFDAAINTAANKQSVFVTIQIHTKSLSQARAFLVVLEESALFDQIEMMDSRKQSSADDAPVNSTIRAAILSQTTQETTP